MAESKYTMNRFIKKEDFKDFTFCTMFIIGLTELLKILFWNVDPRILALISSVIMNLAIMFFVEDENELKKNFKVNLINALINVIPTSISAMGMYDVAIKSLIDGLIN